MQKKENTKNLIKREGKMMKKYIEYFTPKLENMGDSTVKGGTPIVPEEINTTVECLLRVVLNLSFVRFIF